MIQKQSVRVLFLTGTIGVGKTTVATEIGVVLGEHSLPHAIVDLDWLGWVDVGPRFRAHDQLIMRNLAAIWPNLQAIGVEFLVLTRGLTDRALPEALRRAFPEAEIVVVRLTAAAETIEARLRQRDQGAILHEHLAETRAMTEALDAAEIEDFAVSSDEQSPPAVAKSILSLARWIECESTS